MNRLTTTLLLACAGMTMQNQSAEAYPNRRPEPLLMQAGTAAKPPLNLSQKLPITTRIDVHYGGKWIRGVVSEDEGPSASKIKVRVGPENTFAIVPRDSVRLAARPASIAIGDHFEWYDSSVYSYVPAFVKGIGTGNYAGQYLMAYDSKPNSIGMYTKPENLFLPLSDEGAARGSSAARGIQPELGKYLCYAYGEPTMPRIFLGDIDLRAGGAYSGNNLEGRYSYDAASQTLNWLSGWLKDNKFGGKLESNAVIRISQSGICTHL